MPFAVIGQVLIILAATIILGEVFEQFELPAVAGALLAGLLLGPTLLGIIQPSSQLSAIESLSLFFIMFFIGMEMKTELITKNIGKALSLSGASFILPLVFVSALTYILLGFVFEESFATALAITVPSISIISVLVRRYKLLDKTTGYLILSSVILTDIIAFVLLIFISRPFGSAEAALIETGVVIFVVLVAERIVRIYSKGFNRALRRIKPLLKSSNIAYGIILIFGFFFAVVFNYIGITYIIGAFFAGLIVHSIIYGRSAYGRVTRTFGRITDGFFIPLFFGIAGASALLDYADTTLKIAMGVALIIVAAVISSYVLTYKLSNRIIPGNYSKKSRRAAGILSSRGAVGVAIATIALSSGIIGNLSYSIIIFATVVISIIAAVFLRGVGTTQKLDKGKALKDIELID
ncbi:MAG: cation:proton antiporter [Candidatus Marsarchaeota archaeon]|nr:cation:proton antiporter [Candidatus Marsarchaeota archaeon]